jgi:hypothetical protein
MTSPKSALSVNPTTCEISIRKTNKIQRRRSRIPNPKLECVFEIPENLLNDGPMRGAWESLKAQTQAHDKLNIRSCRREVHEGANHASILPLVNSITIFIWTK